MTMPLTEPLTDADLDAMLIEQASKDETVTITGAGPSRGAGINQSGESRAWTMGGNVD